MSVIEKMKHENCKVLDGNSEFYKALQNSVSGEAAIQQPVAELKNWFTCEL